jgi:hypothetical protein
MIAFEKLNYELNNKFNQKLNMNNILIGTGRFSCQEVSELSFCASKNFSIAVLAKNQKEVDLLERYGLAENTKVFNKEKLSKDYGTLNQGDQKIIDITYKILDSHITNLILDRKNPSTDKIKGINNLYRYVLKLVREHYKELTSINPDYLITFYVPPHFINMWVRKMVAHELGIKILLVGARIGMSNLRGAYNGIFKDAKFCEFVEESSQKDENLKLVNDYIQKVNTDYKTAIPDYEQKRLERNRGKVFNFKQIIKKHWKRPSFVKNSYQCWKAYNTKARSINKKEQFITLFLHYQPEVSTLPTGYGFTQQLLALYALRTVTPIEVKIYVKEHPSTFSNKCDPTQRDPEFYEEIKSIKGVELVKMEEDQFDLIDHSICVCTITGNVGLEALLRGTPAIFFGMTSLKDVYGVHNYTGTSNLQTFIHSILNYRFNENDIKKSIKEKLKFFSINAFAVSNINPNSKEVEDCNKHLLKMILEGKISIN